MNAIIVCPICAGRLLLENVHSPLLYCKCESCGKDHIVALKGEKKNA